MCASVPVGEPSLVSNMTENQKKAQLLITGGQLLFSGVLFFVMGAIVRLWISYVFRSKNNMVKPDVLFELDIPKDHKFLCDFNTKLNNFIETLKKLPERKKHFIPWKLKFVYDPIQMNILNLVLSNGYIISGPPSTGKNHSMIELYKRIKEEGLGIKVFTCANIETGIRGGAENTLDHIYKVLIKEAENSPLGITIVVFDEFTSFCSKPNVSNGFSSQVNKFLTLIDGFETKNNGKIIFIGLTNYLEQIAEPVLSRLSHIEFKFDSEVFYKLISHQDYEYRALLNSKLFVECIKPEIVYYYKTNQKLVLRDIANIYNGLFQGYIASECESIKKLSNEQLKNIKKNFNDKVPSLFEKYYKIEEIKIVFTPQASFSRNTLLEK